MKIAHDELRRHTEHLKPEPTEISIPLGIRSAPLSVDATIDLHDEPERRSDEVGDVPIVDNDLPPKWHPEATPAKRPPEHALGFRREPAHVLSAGSEELLTSGRNDARRLEHVGWSARHGARAQPTRRRLRDVRGAILSCADMEHGTQRARPAKPEPRAGREACSRPTLARAA